MTWALWCLGFPDRALRLSRELLQVVVQHRDELAVAAQTLVFTAAVCFTHQLRRETEGVQESVRRLRATIEGRQEPFGDAVAEFYQGWVDTLHGSLEQGLQEMRSGLAYLFQYQVAERPYLGSYLAEALARAGRVEEGLQMLEEGLEQTERTGERWSEAELWRLKGELLLQWPSSPALLPQQVWEKGEQTVARPTLRGQASCRADEAEACFRQAIAVAQRQEARSWELRATTSLARLLASKGRIDEARETLSAIYGWFTEGFDAPDLLEAKAVLETLQKQSHRT
jgi:predicted ATPase